MFRWVALAAAVVCVVAFAGVIVSRSSTHPSQQEQGAEHNSEHSNKEGNKTLWDTWFPDSLSLYTLALVVFTAILAFGGLYQLRALERAERISAQAANAAKDSADATKRAVELAEKNAVRQLRAYVSLADDDHEVRFTEQSGAVFRITLAFKNSGQTPAYKFKWRGNVALGHFPLVHPLVITADEIGGETIGPGTKVYATFNGGAFDEQDIARFRNGDVLYVYGVYEYFDAFDQRRTGKFRLVYFGPSSSRRGQLASDNEGNDAD